MGHCITVCRTVKPSEEIDKLLSTADSITGKYSSSPNFSKIVFLQLKIKKFLKQHKNLKILTKENIVLKVTNTEQNTDSNKNTTLPGTKISQQILMVSKQRKNSYNNSSLLDFCRKFVFTREAVLWDWQKEEIIDYFNGLADDRRKLIRTREEPEKAFAAHPSAILKGVYLSGLYGYKLSEKLIAAAGKQAHYLKLLKRLKNKA